MRTTRREDEFLSVGTRVVISAMLTCARGHLTK